MCLTEGGSYIVKTGNQPHFSTEFGNIKYNLADFGKFKYCREGNFMFLRTECSKVPILRT